ncbi:MAG: hypothetical protein K2J61_03180, partial [Clostridia bacterium]|nr:hypothetical protein [Clostridia bacterium]
MKIKRKTFVGGLLATLCACTALTFGAVFTSSATTANAISSGSIADTNKIMVPELTLSGYNSSTGKVFDGKSLAKLYDAILGTKYKGKGTLTKVKETLKDSSGNYNKTLTGYTADNTPQTVTVPNARTAGDIYTANDNKDVFVDLGGLEWELTYVTLDKNGNVIVDLWLSTSPLTSSYSGGSGNTHSFNSTLANISNIYSTSFIRSQTLNAGTLYYNYSTTNQSTAGTAATSYGQSAANIYAPFTMSNGALSGSDKANQSLIDYIVKPTDVKYQEVESWPGDNGVTEAGISYRNPGTTWNHANEAYGVPYAENYYTYYRTASSATPVASSTSGATMLNSWYGGSSGVNATGTACNHKANYADWQNDYIWLPSLSETGNTPSVRAGLWQVSPSQRANNNTNPPSTITTTNALTWLRTSSATNCSNAFYLTKTGENVSTPTSAKLAVRPALHLNLTAAANAAGTNGADYETVNIPQSGSITYNAKDYTKLSDVLAQVKKEVQTANPSADDPILWYEEDFHKLDVGTASNQYLSTSGAAVQYKVEYTQQGKTAAETPQTSFKIRDAGTYKITCKFTDTTRYRWRDPSDGSVDADGTAEKTFTITVKQAEIKFNWANDSSMTGASWAVDFDKAFIDGNAATANAPWVYLDYTLLTGDTAKDNDTSGGASGTIADSKYPYIVLKYVEKVNTYGDTAITVDNVRTRITNTKGTNYPKEAQTYTVTFEDKNAATSNYKLVPDTGESASRDYTINKKKITAPAKLAALEYTGAEQSFTVAQYDGDVMEYGTLSGTTFTAASAPTDMTADTTNGLVLKATNVGKYKVAFRPIVSQDSNGNDVIRNYEWQTNATGSNVYEVEYEIKAKALEFDFTSSADNGSFTIKTDTTGKVTVSYKTGKGPIEDENGVAEAVEAEIFVYYDKDGEATAVVNPGATWNEISFADLKDKTGTHTTGDYTIGVRLKSNVEANKNYTIDTTSAATYTKGITINAGEASIDDMKLSFKDSTMGSNDPLQGLPVTDQTAGTKNLQFSIGADGNPVAYFPQLDFDGSIFEMDGTPTYRYDGETADTPFSTGLTAAGKVTVTVKIKIKTSEQATNKMPASYTGSKFKTYTKDSDTEATVTFEYTIDKMEIDTSAFKLQYSYDKTNWKDFATKDNKVEYASATIYVRIDPTSLAPANAGISVMFGTTQYAEGKNKGTYPVTANFTLTDNDNFTINSATYNWEITNKQINVTNWVPGDFKIDGIDHIGEIMVINGHKDLYDKGVIEYVYTWSAMDGSNGSGAGETELANIFAVASPTNQVTVTATVQLKAGMSATYDLLGTSLTSQAFYVGAAKETATITNAGSAVYGSVNESAFGVKVEADGANLPATNPLTGALLYEVYLHDYDGLSVDNISGDGYGLLSGVDYSKLNAGKYVIEVRLTEAGAQDYAPKGARQLFEITPKKIVVPQVTKDIVYNGGYINISDYLDGNYDADIMSTLSGYTNKSAGSYTVTFKLNSTNYIW